MEKRQHLRTYFHFGKVSFFSVTFCVTKVIHLKRLSTLCGNWRNLLTPTFLKNSVKSTLLVPNQTVCCFHVIFHVKVILLFFHTVGSISQKVVKNSLWHWEENYFCKYITVWKCTKFFHLSKFTWIQLCQLIAFWHFHRLCFWK